ncbi:MAG: glycoside hydrolase 15-related [Deltaproteobacteria bacterium]|nr:glycoside hydrolase 15-related [Deltaproteobacteria bacterium]MBP2682330.1 glycoside hydrolase 15-related [Deltaproteobacteria bacterium]MBP2685450.1 glycoside hydrolase 15-related [Deltaproteobacteria bacterium]
MGKDTDRNEAFGGPGIPPRWTHGAKDGVGTAYASSSRLWFTLWNGVVTEVYYPTVDRPQLRDLQFLITDGESFFHEEKRHLHSATERLSHHVLGYRITNSDPEGRYFIIKEVLSDPHLPCLLVNTTLSGGESFLKRLRLYALCAPHLGMGGLGNNARVVKIAGRNILTAEKDGVWLALAATVPFSRLSCGYVGQSDGWTDLAVDYRMDWEFDRAMDGNIALTGELDLGDRREFTMGLAFGDGLHNAAATLLESLVVPFGEHRERFADQWNRSCRRILPLEKAASDGGDLYHGSYSLLLAHEDKTFPGAFIASLSIPWGESKGDDDRGGYHLVWTRDMVNTATGLLAAGNTESPLRALVYLAVSQHEDGGFSQNFWIDGESYWGGIQLDEVAFPILLAWRLLRKGNLGNFDPYPMVMGAARYLILHGPATQQERWEEAGGYSPSTIASNIAALVCAGSFARERGDGATAAFLEEYADFLECHIEAWMVTTEGTLVPGIPRHYIRILPVDVNDPFPPEDPNLGVLALANRPPGSRWRFPSKEIVDGGFLELVRYGIRKADDPLIVDSLRVLDAVLKVDTPDGPCWRRYNNDGYGQREDGGPFIGYGKGRAWPLLTGERGQYELAAGRPPGPYLRALEGFASPTGLLPEQVWDEPDRPDLFMFLGRPTGSARPLMWAHAEYIKLLRSAADSKVFDLVPEVADRYLSGSRQRKPMEIWKHNRQVPEVREGVVLRIQAGARFRLRWTRDDWGTLEDSHSTPTPLGIDYFDFATRPPQGGRIRFTFFWIDAGTWEGKDFEVAVRGS